MDISEFSKGLSALTLIPQEKHKEILSLAQEMEPNVRSSFFEDLQDVNEQESQIIQKELQLLKGMEATIQKGEKAVKKMQRTINIIEEEQENKNILDEIDKQIQKYSA